jgi:NAD(P)-dependent dehydrogenase (short-subunit alcohol dehydrogenase family)
MKTWDSSGNFHGLLQLDKTFNINARGSVFLGAEAAATDDRWWINRVGLVGHARHSHSWPSHLCSVSYARTWAAEFKDRGIRVNALSPGVTDTPILDSQSEEREALVNVYLSMIPIRRLARAGEIARASTAALRKDRCVDQRQTCGSRRCALM